MTHICLSNLTIIGSDNGLSPGRRQAIIWTSAGISFIGPFIGTNFSEILIKILTFSFKKMRLKLSSGKRRPFCLGLNVDKCRLLYSQSIKGHIIDLVSRPSLSPILLTCWDLHVIRPAGTPVTLGNHVAGIHWTGEHTFLWSTEKKWDQFYHTWLRYEDTPGPIHRHINRP